MGAFTKCVERRPRERFRGEAPKNEPGERIRTEWEKDPGDYPIMR